MVSTCVAFLEGVSQLTSSFLIDFLSDAPYRVPYFPTTPTFFVRLVMAVLLRLVVYAVDGFLKSCGDFGVVRVSDLALPKRNPNL